MVNEARAGMVATTARRLAYFGLQGTSIADVLADSGAARGSVYHHFPGGKDELVGAAVGLVGERFLAEVEDRRGAPAEVIVRRYFDHWRDILTRSDLAAGCPVLAVATESASPDLIAQTGAVFRSWTDGLADLLRAGGVRDAAARDYALLLLASGEGGVAIARAQRAVEPLDTVERLMLEQLPAVLG